MERSSSIKFRARASTDCGASQATRRLAGNRFLWVLACLSILVGAPIARADSVVLIVSAASPIQQLESSAVRKAFMGFNVVADGVSVRAARNRSDPRLDKIFFQNIVGLSELVYERQLLSRKYLQASALPMESFNDNQLLDAIARDPGLVGYAWEASAAKRSDVRILRTLWHD
jgi:hypothetical protein